MSKYPAWICEPCGKTFGRVIPGHCATFHQPDADDPKDCCGWCGTKSVALTEPRDFGYPDVPARR